LKTIEVWLCHVNVKFLGRLWIVHKHQNKAPNSGRNCVCFDKNDKYLILTTGKSQISLGYPASEPARKLVCELLASWTA